MHVPSVNRQRDAKNSHNARNRECYLRKFPSDLESGELLLHHLHIRQEDNYNWHF